MNSAGIPGWIERRLEMDCRNTEEMIQQYLDLSLSSDQKRELEAHVEICSSCRNQMNSYKSLISLFEEQEVYEVPANFTDCVMEKLPQRRQNGRGEHGAFFERNLSVIRYGVLSVAAVFIFALLNLNDPFFQKDQHVAPPVEVARRVEGAKVASDGSQGLVVAQNTEETPLAVPSETLKLRVEGGVVQVRSKTGSKIVKNGDSLLLAMGDEVETGAMAKAYIEYPQGKVELGLKASTKVQVDSQSIRLYRGNSWVHVVRKGTEFEVKTPNMIAAVRGTVFTVGVAPLQTKWMNETDPLRFLSQVNVFEGHVEVGSRTSDVPSLHLYAGDSVRSEGVALAQTRKISSDSWDYWSFDLNQAQITKPQVQVEEVSSVELNQEINPEQAFGEVTGR